MDPSRTLSTGSAFGVARLALLVVALAGFFAMHGVAATDQSGAHHNPMLAVADAAPHGGSGQYGAGGEGPHDPVAGEAPARDDPGHALMAGCLFVLLGALAALALRALRTVPPMPAASVRSPRDLAQAPARGPPRPLFIVLCVHRA